MRTFAPNTDLADARRFRAGVLLVMSIFLLVSFGLAAAGVDDHKLLTGWDEQGKQLLHEHARANEPLFRAAWQVTQLGAMRLLVLESMVVITVLACLRCWNLAGIFAVTTLGGFKIVDVLKQFYDRARPAFLDPFVLEESKSFPSGHAAGSAIFYGMLAYLIIRATRRLGWFVAPLLGVLIVAIGASRVYLGAHWVSDVVGGWLLGFGWLALGMAAAEVTREH